MTRLAWILAGIAVLILLACGVLYFSHSYRASSGNSALGMQEGGAPWVAETNSLRARLAADNLPALTAEGEALHIHQHLDIFLDGVLVPVPQGIGIGPDESYIAPIHVHDVSGIIHVESPTVENFTLGQFFDVWGVTFSATRIGGYYNTGEKKLRVYVNGAPYDGDPRSLVLAAHQEIAIVYGTEAEIPPIIPSVYNFPKGY